MTDEEDRLHRRIHALTQELDFWQRRARYFEEERTTLLKRPVEHVIAPWRRRLDDAERMLKRWCGQGEKGERGLVYLAVRLALFRRWQRIRNWRRYL